MKAFAVSSHLHPTLRCPVHGCRMCSLRAPTGGAFWACVSSLETECAYTVSYDGAVSGDPAVVCRASKKRSRATSRRELVLARMLASGFRASRETAVSYLDEFGLFVAEAETAAHAF